MTTAEALAVVREALLPLHLGGKGWEGVGPTPQMDALAALALIEQEMERLFRENNRLGEALAYERNEIAPAERRVAELEAALRDCLDVQRKNQQTYWDQTEYERQKNAELEAALREARADFLGCRDEMEVSTQVEFVDECIARVDAALGGRE